MYKANEKDLSRVLAQIYRITGFDARQYRASTLKRRIERRLLATKSKSYKEYLAFLKKNPSESHKFLDVLSINITDFFRDKRVFFTLKRKILPDLLEKISAGNRKKIRIWSIGCSRGQEPYSLAIILSEIKKSKKDNLKIIIHATDVNRAALKQAVRAQYKKIKLKNVSDSYLNKYFTKIKDNGFKIKDNIRKLVRFRYHDLIKGNTLGEFDLILCRNLFIFFNPELQKKMFKKIYASLKKEGILILGTAETPKNENLFYCISSRDHTYKKIT
jgi:chemotaxis methyl-accepting protein methylase